jgi:hypothetical protein
MSGTTAFTVDPYLAAQDMPTNELTVDPKFHNIRIVTPVGRLPYIHVDAPFAIPNANAAPGTAPRLSYSATLLMAPGTQEKPIVLDIYRAIVAVADAHWPAVQRPDPQNPSNIITVPGSQLLGVDSKAGGLHYPLRKGDDNYMKNPQTFAAWRGLFFINCGMNPKTKAGVDQRPVCLDEKGMACDPKIFYPGCYGRLQVTVAPFDTNGNKGVTLYLNAVQFARHGERMASFDAGAQARTMFGRAGALPGDVGAPPAGGAPVGFGPNTATPGSTPPGVPFGFAAPPAAAAAPTQQAAAPAFAGARPPGI